MKGLTRPERERRVRSAQDVVFGPRADSLCRGRTHDLSARGLCIESRTVFPPQTTLHLHLGTLRQDAALVGHVRWSTPVDPLTRTLGRMGIQLEAADDRLRGLLTASDLVSPVAAALPRRLAPQLVPTVAEWLRGKPAYAPKVTRTAPRIAERLPLRFAQGGRVAKGCSFDLSAKGIGFLAEVLPTRGDHLTLAMALPDGDFAVCEGSVIWTAARPRQGLAGHVGLALDRVDDAFSAHLARVSVAIGA